MRFANFIPYPMKIIEIGILSYHNKCPCGVLDSPFYAQEMQFQSLFGLLTMIERILDELDYPEPTVELRTFGNEGDRRPGDTQASGTLNGNTLAKFRVSVLFRQNATWQGSLHWVEKDEIASFRSVFEMIKLIDSALGHSDEGGTQHPTSPMPELP